jgi:hypothetical protein
MTLSANCCDVNMGYWLMTSIYKTQLMPNTDLASGGSERPGTRPVPETYIKLYFMHMTY